MNYRWFALLAIVSASGCAASAPPAPAPSAPNPVRAEPTAPPSASAPDVSAPVGSAAPIPTNPPAGQAPSRVTSRTFSSAALGVDKRYVVWLPKGYDDSEHRFPVLVLLHGLGGNENNWVDHGMLPSAADATSFPAVVVMPDGDDGFYANSPTPAAYDACLKQKPPFDKSEPPTSYCVKTPAYEDYIVRDLVADVDAHWRTVPERGRRAIAGLSMGGFGAVSLAMRHPDLFVAAASHSGMLSLLYAGPHPYVRARVTTAQDVAHWGAQYQSAFREHVKRVFGPNLATWQSYDPTTMAPTLGESAPALYFDCGTSDGYKFQDHAQYLNDLLTERGKAHEFALAPGDHNWAYWSARLPFSLRFLSKALSAP